MKIVGISGSPTAVSRSASLLQLAQQRLDGVGSRIHTIVVRDLPAEGLLHAQFDHPQIRNAIAEVADAQVVLVSTPIYKAAYSGLLKAFLDLLPQDSLYGKTVLPLATGGSIAHLLALDYALKPVLSALGAHDILTPVFATDVQLPRHETLGYAPLDEVRHRIGRSLQTVVDRAEAYREQEAATREREALLARLQLNGAEAEPPDAWASRDVRWSI